MTRASSAATTPAGRDDAAAAAPADVAARLEIALDQLPALSGQPRAVALLDGGLTNVNVKVTTPERTAVVRLSSSDGDLLAIDRAAEDTNSRRAAESGAAPAVLDYLPELRVLVVEWVEGRTLAPEDLRDEGNARTRGRRVPRCCTEARGSTATSTCFGVQRRYLSLVQERGFRLPPRYVELMPEADRIAESLAVRRTATVPCNNDLLAANFIDDGDRLWVIDYEYSGNNDACFELGNIWGESHLSPRPPRAAGRQLLRRARCTTRWRGRGCSA